VVAGRIFDVQQSYSTAFWLLAGLAGLGMVLMLQVRPVVDSRR
jgi:hypothetical protein